jgi:hypothetical protein
MHTQRQQQRGEMETEIEREERYRLTRLTRCIHHYPGHYSALFKNLVAEEEPWYQSCDGQHRLYRGCTTRIGVTDGTNFVLAGTACYLVLIELLSVKRSKRIAVRPDTHSAHVYYVPQQQHDDARHCTSPASAVADEDSHTINDLMAVARNNSTINRIKKKCLVVKCEWSTAKHRQTTSDSDDEMAC